MVLLEPKKVEGHDQKKFPDPHFCARPVLPHFQIRFVATAPDLLLLIQQKLRFVQYRYGSLSGNASETECGLTMYSSNAS